MTFKTMERKFEYFNFLKTKKQWPKKNFIDNNVELSNCDKKGQ